MTAHGPWLADAMNDYLSGATIKAIAVTGALSADVEFRSSVVNEITGTGYTSGGVAVTGFTVVYASGRIVVDCDTIDFGIVDSSGEVAGVSLYISTGSSATDQMIATSTFPPIETNGTFTYTPSASGFMQVNFL